MFKRSREYWNQYIQILNVWYGYIEKYIKQKKISRYLNELFSEWFYFSPLSLRFLGKTRIIIFITSFVLNEINYVNYSV